MTGNTLGLRLVFTPLMVAQTLGGSAAARRELGWQVGF